MSRSPGQRADLLALTPQALAALANMGLVKRAQREYAGAAAPRLAEAADGTVTGTFGDGVVSTLPPHTTLAQTACTCGAKSICRHRIGVVLAYAAWSTEQRDPAAIAPAPAPGAWSPAQIDDATLVRVLGDRMVARAQKLRHGLLVSVDLGVPPTAKLPTCTVRFLVPGDVAYAQCDCAAVGGACEHLALAVWAFRSAAERGARGVFELRDESRAAPAEPPSADHHALHAAAALATELLEQGIERMPAAAGKFATLRAQLTACGATWLHDVVADLEQALAGYHQRSARHGVAEVAALLAELGARLRAAGHGSLPRRYVLGQDTAPETKLDHLRLVALGAQVEGDGEASTVSVYFAEPSAGQVLVLRKRIAAVGDGLGARRVGGFALAALAHSQLVSKAVTRQAKGLIELGSRAGQSSLAGPSGGFASLPEPLLVRDLRGHGQRCAQRPPRALRPRLLTDDLHVVAIDEVQRSGYDAAQQTLWAELRAPCGTPLYLRLGYQRAARHALDAVAEALREHASQRSPIHHVAGFLTWHDGAWSLTPTALDGPALLVPALASARNVALPSNSRLPLDHSPQRQLAELLRQTQGYLETLCSAGVQSPAASVLARGDALRASLDDAGFAGLATRLATLLAVLRAGTDAATAWLDLAVRLALCGEADGDMTN